MEFSLYIPIQKENVPLSSYLKRKSVKIYVIKMNDANDIKNSIVINYDNTVNDSDLATVLV